MPFDPKLLGGLTGMLGAAAMQQQKAIGFPIIHELFAEEEILKKGGKKLDVHNGKPVYIIEQGSGIDPEHLSEILDCDVIQVNPGKINAIRELNDEGHVDVVSNMEADRHKLRQRCYGLNAIRSKDKEQEAQNKLDCLIEAADPEIVKAMSDPHGLRGRRVGFVDHFEEKASEFAMAALEADPKKKAARPKDAGGWMEHWSFMACGLAAMLAILAVSLAFSLDRM